METLEMLTHIRKFKNQNPWAVRVVSELGFAYKLLEIDNSFDAIVEKAIETLYEEIKTKGYVNEEIVYKIEEILSPMSRLAKEFTIICVGHAHIDMNWMWGYHETVAVTLDTFKTVLNLMKEYPEFTFSQSQASVYRIVEKYYPKMLEEIKKRVEEGRWEITASTWVEADKNMPNGESLARHILYTKQYISKLFGIDKDELVIDFEPDTFGHSRFIPEILKAGGVKYYYHCRGNDNNVAYRWISPSSSEVLVYNEPFWYNDSIKPEMALYAPEFYKLFGLKHMLKVYGVGDHGGGPTRKDIETIIRLNSYPIYPTIKFGTYKEFFSKLEEYKDRLPVVNDELNFVFDGCYTTQSRIKMANRLAEAAIEEAEKFSLLSKILSNYEYPAERLKEAWENILFSHFHDIIPGSGVIETREYAMGKFQETMAILLSQKKIALEEIALSIDTKSIANTNLDGADAGDGAGVGFGSSDYKISQDSVGTGKRRIFHLFNPSLKERKEIIEIVLWDWDGDLDRLVVMDVNGVVIPHQIIEKGFNDYWGHQYIKVLIEAKVPAYGYTTYIIDERSAKDLTIRFHGDPRVQKPHEFVLENQKLRAIFDTSTAKLISLYDKENDVELIDKDRGGAHFRLIYEDITSGANAWVVGRYLDVLDIHRNVKIRKGISGALRDSIIFEFEFGSSSKLAVEVILDKDSNMLKFETKVDFKEIADLKKGIIPQLSFYVPLRVSCDDYIFDVPCGVIERKEYDLDMPGLTFACAKTKEYSLAIFSKTKYGYRAKDNSISLTLLRSSHEPDPYPEFGRHKIEFALFVGNHELSNYDIIEQSYNYNHDISVISNDIHEGNLPAEMKFMDIETSSSVVSAIKRSENYENKLIIRLYEVNGKHDKVNITLYNLKPLNAYFTDINEEKILKEGIALDQNRIYFVMSPYEFKTIVIEFENCK